MGTEVIAMKGNIDDTGRKAQAFAQTAGEFDPAVGDAQQHQSPRVGVARCDGGGQPTYRGVDLR
jgi:hypothetical protein